MRGLRTFLVFIAISIIATGKSARSELKDLYDAHPRDALADSDRRSRVLLKQIGPERCVGNLGLDLLRQADWFKMDFGAMTLVGITRQALENPLEPALLVRSAGSGK
jgi:hypothetical protein